MQDDFSCEDYDCSADKKTILFNIPADAYDEQEIPSEVTSAIYRMWRNQFEKDDSSIQMGDVCYSLSDEFAGCITASSLFSSQDDLMTVTSLFVPEQCRGLGIGTELLNLCITKLENLGKKWVLIPNFIKPDVLEPLLTRLGFKKFSSGYILQF